MHLHYSCRSMICKYFGLKLCALLFLVNSFLFCIMSNAVEAADDFDYEKLLQEPAFGNDYAKETDAGFCSSFITEPMRFNLGHEISYKFEDIKKIVNNRTSFRLEYSKYFLDVFYLQFDYKITSFWNNDHRKEAEENDAILENIFDDRVLLEQNTKEAFLQVSLKNTSIKAGKQILIWGESDVGAITDVISPRDYSEAFFISLDESRIGQLMITLDQFTDYGTWSLFWVPDPDFNEYPKKGTAYYYDPLQGNAVYRSQDIDGIDYEYGGRWKKIFGKSDISVMAASLIDNDYDYRIDGIADESGKMLISEIKQRYSMFGVTFNYARGNFLYKGEVAYNSPKSYSDANYQIINRDQIDSSLALEYSPGGGFYTLSLEFVNNYVVDWVDQIRNAPENTNSIVLGWRRNFLNDDLSLDWMTIYSEPQISYLHSLRTSYKWNDNVISYLNLHCPVVKDRESAYWNYRDQKQIVFKTEIHF